jgi:hypothetical protein
MKVWITYKSEGEGERAIELVYESITNESKSEWGASESVIDCIMNELYSVG